MADTLTLVGLMLNFAGALLLVLHRFPALEVTDDGRGVATQAEPSPEERSRNLRRYWRNAVATRAGLLCLCVGFAFQLLGFIYPDYGTDATRTTTTLHQVNSSVTCARPSSPPGVPSPGA
ncbi:MAG TPA: hypothetical protein VKD22_08480 [Ramlibacter sp.]|nr:hypothetical protein [Ramlibacter sp.]